LAKMSKVLRLEDYVTEIVNLKKKNK
jgi:hypothetical protein